MFLNAYVCDIDNKTEGAWLYLPCTDDDLCSTLIRAGIEGNEYKISMYETDIDGLAENLTEYEDLEKLNTLTMSLSTLTDYGLEGYQALLQLKRNEGIGRIGKTDTLIDYVFAIKDYQLLPMVQTYEDLAHCFVNEVKFCNVPEKTKKYIKYKELGEKIHAESGGSFTKYGYIFLSSQFHHCHNNLTIHGGSQMKNKLLIFLLFALIISAFFYSREAVSQAQKLS